MWSDGGGYLHFVQHVHEIVGVPPAWRCSQPTTGGFPQLSSVPLPLHPPTHNPTTTQTHHYTHHTPHTTQHTHLPFLPLPSHLCFFFSPPCLLHLCNETFLPFFDHTLLSLFPIYPSQVEIHHIVQHLHSIDLSKTWTHRNISHLFTPYSN